MTAAANSRSANAPPAPPHDDAQAQLILASASPRRLALLQSLGLRVLVRPADIDESQFTDEPPTAYVARLASAKARAVAHASDDRLAVLAADTVVVVDGEVLGKPRDRSDAVRMLLRLSARTHEVLTSVALVVPAGFRDASTGSAVTSHGEVETVGVRTVVHFRAIDQSEAAAYWSTGEPRDKAGAYGIQGIGGIFATRIEGSFTAVMGLPVAETEALLQRAGVDTWAYRAELR